MVDRINLILKVKNITPKQFAEEIGIQPSGMSHIMSGRNRPSLDFVMKVVTRYPEIDIRWLTLGIGEMYVPTTPVVDTVPKQKNVSHMGNVANADSKLSGTVASGFVTQDNDKDRQQGVVSPGRSTIEMPDLFSSIEPEPKKIETTPIASMANQEKNDSALPHFDDTTTGRKTDDREQSLYEIKNDSESVVASGVMEAATAEVFSDVEHQLLPHQDGVESNGKTSALIDKKEMEMPSLQQGGDDEQRASGVACSSVKENKGKRIVKFVILYDDHSFAEYYPEIR